MFFSCCGSVAAHFKHAATRQPRRKLPLETCVDTTAKLRPQASVLALRAAGANQLFEACVDNTAKLRPQASALALRPCACNAQQAAPRETACTPRSSTRVAPRASGGHRDQALATHNDRRCGKRPRFFGNNSLSTTIIPHSSAASFEVNSEPHTGARPSVRLCVGPELSRCVHIHFEHSEDHDHGHSSF